METLKILGIIPARGGSKGVPRKNVRLLAGKPLIAYTAESALSSMLLTRTVVSTDDPEIAEIARTFGLEAPFLRPAELALDETPTFPVVLHSLIAMEAGGEKFDAVCLLQPINPLRTSQDIDACIRLLDTSGADSVISVLPVPDTYNPKWVYWKTPEGQMELSTGDTEPISRRQDLPKAFHRDGTVYVARRNVLFDYGNLYGKNVRGYSMDPSRSINIDTMEDWHAIEHMMSVTTVSGNW